jgi:trimethylamine--corrinoid protein Co-methyltransferase
MNDEYYYPHTADRRSRADWEQAGARDMREAARQRARELLAASWPSHIPETLDTRLRGEFDIRLPRAAMLPAS